MIESDMYDTSDELLSVDDDMNAGAVSSRLNNSEVTNRNAQCAAHSTRVPHTKDCRSSHGKSPAAGLEEQT